MKSPTLVEHFFRHEYSRLVARFSRQVGLQHMEKIEDSVQSALLTGLENWANKNVPENPTAWLYKVANNNLMNQLRQHTTRERILLQNKDEFIEDLEVAPKHLLSKELDDDLLRMMFVCCNSIVPVHSQLVLALKILCGFSITEIAYRLFSTEANIYKRFSRAKLRLLQCSTNTWDLNSEIISSRLPTVHRILYLLFTEGHLSVNNEFDIRLELCEEAIRLATVLAEHPAGQIPETFALLALMYLHTSRMSGRQDGSGGLLLLQEQDRKHWDQQKIQIGLTWLAKSASGENFSRYHAEAGIAAEHCLAPSFQDTRWDQIAQSYLLLEQKTAPSAIHRLNRAIAIAEWQGPAAGLAILKNFKPPSWLTGSYLWSAVLADLHLRCGDLDLAKSYRDNALKLAPTPTVQTLLKRRLKLY